jgi:hypothetical protein
MNTVYKGRPVEIELEFDDNWAYATYGNYTDGNMEELTDAELNEVGAQADYSDAVLDRQIMRAEHAFEGDR